MLVLPTGSVRRVWGEMEMVEWYDVLEEVEWLRDMDGAVRDEAWGA